MAFSDIDIIVIKKLLTFVISV